jgi:purine-binding chemotaxis protein CheW
MATSTLPVAPTKTPTPKTRAGKYLIFQLGHEEYGIEVLKVREIMGLQEITPVPNTPTFVKGVINLRGKVIPVVDLRIRFGIEERDHTSRTCVIVVHVQHLDGPIPMGIIVDGVAEVLNISESDIEDTPDFGSKTDLTFLLGMANMKDGVKLLLSLDDVLDWSAMDVINLKEIKAAAQ